MTSLITEFLKKHFPYNAIPITLLSQRHPIPLLLIYTRSHQRVSIISRSLSSPDRPLVSVRLSRITFSASISFKHGTVIALSVPKPLFNLIAEIILVKTLIVICHWDQDTLYETTTKIRYKNLVFDSFDPVYKSLNNPSVETAASKLIEAERSLLINSNLILSRDLRIASLRRFAPEIKGKQLVLYPEYIEEGVHNPKPLTNFNTPSIHYTYAGNLDLDIGSPSNFISALLPILSYYSCKIFVYCSYRSTYRQLHEMFAGYIANGTLIPCKKVHHTRLIEAISRHHIGLNLTKPDQSLSHATYSESAFRASLGSKLFNYISAGLPTVCESHTFCGYLVNRYHLGCSIDSLEQLIPATRNYLSRTSSSHLPDHSRLTINYNRTRLSKAINDL